jgi:hypothetical protein
MVLICNNDVLTIEQFHLNRCVEKNEILNIVMKLREEKKNQPRYVATKPDTNDYDAEMDRAREVYYSKFENKATKYNYRRK